MRKMFALLMFLQNWDVPAEELGKGAIAYRMRRWENWVGFVQVLSVHVGFFTVAKSHFLSQPSQPLQTRQPLQPLQTQIKYLYLLTQFEQ